MGTVSERVVPYLLFSIPLNLNEDKYLGKFDTRPNSVKNAEVFGSILGGMVGFSVGSGITQIGSNAVKNSYRSLTNTNVSIMTKTESAIAKQGAIYLEEKNGVWEATNNATPSIFKNKPALLPKTSTATTIKEVYKKTATRKEEPHSTVVKTSTKKESTETISTGKTSSKSSTTGETGSSKTKEVYKKTTTKKESTETTGTGKTSSKSSTTGKETSRIIITDSSKETETEIRNIGDFATIKIEKTNSEIPSAYMIDGMTKGGKEKTSGIGSGSYFESYRGGKTSGSKESGYRGNDEGYKFNGNSSNSSKNASSSTKNELDSKNDSWKFNSETPKTVVKNSEGNYTLGRGNEWSVNNTVTSVKRISENQNNMYNVELNNGMAPGYTLIRKSDIKVTADENKINSHIENWDLRMGSNYKNSPIFGCHTIECMKDILKKHPKIKFDVTDVGDGIKEVRYSVPKLERGNQSQFEEIDGEIQYRSEVKNPKTVYDSQIYNTEELTKKVIEQVKNTVTAEDLNKIQNNSTGRLPLDIRVDGKKIRVNLKDNQKGGIEIDGYYFNTQ